MKTIIVPTDFSENASNAIEYAAQLAKVQAASVLIVHVSRMPIKTPDDEMKLKAICTALNETFVSVKCDYRLMYGDDIPEVIVGFAKTMERPMIVMGTKGLTNLEKFIFGSNTATVITKANCTVLSIPGNNTFVKPKRILFATTFEREDIQSALEIVKLAKAFDASVIIAHVLTDSEVEEIERAKMQLFTREVSLLADYPKISYRLASENTITMGLDDLIENTHADVIAMRTHKRTLLERLINPSITRKYAHESPIPLMAFQS
jgi:nucleotide-binding universal stress UspA family protein